MAHSLSAKKRDRQNEKRHGRNQWRKAQVKTAVKTLEKAIHSGKKEEVPALLSAAYKKLDRVADHGTMHKKTASRKKSRLAKRANKMAVAKA